MSLSRRNWRGNFGSVVLEVEVAPKFFSFTPGFSPVESPHIVGNRFNGFISEGGKTVETVFCLRPTVVTGLKPGVKEKSFLRQNCAWFEVCVRQQGIFARSNKFFSKIEQVRNSKTC